METLIIDGVEFSGASFGMKKLGERYGVTIRETAQIPVDIRKRLGKPIVVVLPVEAVGADALEFEGARRRICSHLLKSHKNILLREV